MAFKTKSRAFVCMLTVLVLLLAPAGRAFADGGGHGLEQEVAGYHVQLVIDGQAVTGENEITVKLFDAQEQPVSEAEVKAYAEPTGEHMESGAGGEHTEGEAAEEHTQPAESSQPASTQEPALSGKQPQATQAPMDMEPQATQPAMSGMGGMQQPQATEAPAMAGMEPPQATQAPSETGETHGEMEGSTEDMHSADEMDNIVFTAGEAPGEYHGALDFAEAGNWTVTVHFATPGTKAAVHFEVEVNSRVNKQLVLGSFAGINASVIIAAAILKRRTLSLCSK